MSIDSALSVASGGLANIAQQMATVSNNVANASTPGYAEEVRKRPQFSESGGDFSGAVGIPLILKTL
jgi:flagellar hook-associated protein FlgK